MEGIKTGKDEPHRPTSPKTERVNDKLSVAYSKCNESVSIKKGEEPLTAIGKVSTGAQTDESKDPGGNNGKTVATGKNFKIPKRCLIAMFIASGVGGLLSLLGVPLLLGAIGFGSAGVTAGSLAALWQSTMGGTIAAGSLFSTLQSIGAVGLGAATSLTVTGATGAAAFAFCAAFDRMIGYHGDGPC